jgi:hypothetical protein
MSKKSKIKKSKRPKNICECGRKMQKCIEDCVFCGGEEYYGCPDWKKCGRMYDLNGKEL